MAKGEKTKIVVKIKIKIHVSVKLKFMLKLENTFHQVNERYSKQRYYLIFLKF